MSAHSTPAASRRPGSRSTVSDNQVVAARLAWASSRLRSWYDDRRIRAQIASSLAPELDRVADESFGASYRDGVGLAVADDPLAWANRVIDLPDGGWALAGIRYRARDTAKPFVDIIACSPPPSGDTIMAVSAAVARDYAAFNPLCVRVALPGTAMLSDLVAAQPGLGPGTAVDQYIVAGIVEALRRRPRVRTFPGVRLVRGDPQELAREAAVIYGELGIRAPSTTLWARAEDADSLAQCAQEGLLLEVRVGGNRAGVVAATREDAHGLTGFVVREMCLDSAHRGRGFGPAALQHLVEELPAKRGDTLWGTIHRDNRASMRNATRVGREPVGLLAWITPPGLPGMPRGV